MPGPGVIAMSCFKRLAGIPLTLHVVTVLLIGLIRPSSCQLSTYPSNCATNPLAGQGEQGLCTVYRREVASSASTSLAIVEA